MVNQTRKRRRIRRTMRGGMEKASQLTPEEAYNKYMKGEYLNDEDFMKAIMEKGEKDPMSKLIDMSFKMKANIRQLKTPMDKASKKLQLITQKAEKEIKAKNMKKAMIYIEEGEGLKKIIKSYEPYIKRLEINLAKLDILISKSRRERMLAQSVEDQTKFIRDTMAKLGNESIAEMTTDFEKMLKDTGVQQERQLEQMKKVSSDVDPDKVAELMVEAEDEAVKALEDEFPDVPTSGPADSQGRAQLKKRSKRKSKSKRKAKSKRRRLMAN
jgi:hypothetical protein